MKYKIVCDWCGKEVERKRSCIKEHNYCSRTCLGKGNAERFRLYRTKRCDYCGKQFEYFGHHSKRNLHFFCCKECSAAFKEKKSVAVCNWCDKTIIRKESAISRYGSHNFCDRGCYQDFLNFEMSGAKNQRVCGKSLYRILAGMGIGRKLKTKEHVHHKDGDHCNHSLENLMIISPNEHSIIHSEEKARDEYGRFIKQE
ncbi:TRASH domain-containing protein [Clostridium grantii DSM 8605]|uniref:TRASH domain-containing protein n=1 Tax=Clostridium grantii DSM 8605 TaxID=1121316 RepID=A0A1M5U734_9CLOT|nr:TRASH domain-containing protein [Clostridium grantii DSM 8605]